MFALADLRVICNGSRVAAVWGPIAAKATLRVESSELKPGELNATAELRRDTWLAYRVGRYNMDIGN